MRGEMVETDWLSKFGIQSAEKTNSYKEKIRVELPDVSNGWEIDMVAIQSGIHFSEFELPVK